jgi:hypothetical protein
MAAREFQEEPTLQDAEAEQQGLELPLAADQDR